MDTIDTGERCERHVGEVFPPRCYDCGNVSEKPPAPRCGFIPGSECSKHSGYPLPCDRCRRDRGDDL